MNDSDEPEAISPDIEDHVAIDGIRILEYLPHFGETMPANDLDDAGPGFDLARRVGIVFHRFAEMSACDNMH